MPLSVEAVATETAKIHGKVAGIRVALDGPQGEQLHAALVELAPVGCF